MGPVRDAVGLQFRETPAARDDRFPDSPPIFFKRSFWFPASQGLKTGRLPQTRDLSFPLRFFYVEGSRPRSCVDLPSFPRSGRTKTSRSPWRPPPFPFARNVLLYDPLFFPVLAFSEQADPAACVPFLSVDRRLCSPT